MIKFKAQFWQLLIHVLMAVAETVVLQQTAELAGGDLFEEPLRLAHFKQSNPDSLLQLYLIQMAIWIVTAVCHIWLFEAQSDYFVMLGHHIVTVALIAISLQNGLLRFGLVVLWVHDVSDIPIDLLKLTNYLKLEDKAGFFVVEASFISCLASWLYLRLYLFPLQVVYRGAYSTFCVVSSIGGNFDHEAMRCPDLSDVQLADSREHYAHLGQLHGEESPYSTTRTWVGTTVVLLATLQLMHVWWYFLFLRILKGIITEGNSHEAGRQQYEGDDDDVLEKSKDA
eukprot:TRINITY_DN2652_c0_g1_i9.p1 TRINITY_DN2652_c0_g1~~TRINITY_DN2652_c0_g1_i9.p1  ORF type:complete len:283 (-),score=75.52 TRINITY_DN2652_c0_g1_i9:198-1046(-)